MTILENTIATVIILLAPVGLIYGWVCYFTPVSEEPTGWRGRATFLSLALVSLSVVLWILMELRMPGADWQSGAGVGHQVAWEYGKARAGFGALLPAFVLCLIGRPRLIASIVVACVGTGLVWIFSTMP